MGSVSVGYNSFVYAARLSFTIAAWMFAGAILFLFEVPRAVAASPSPCEGLGIGRTIGDATVLASRSVPPGPFDVIAGQKLNLPEFCRVVAIAAPTPASNIVIEIWLPASDRWNGKILGTGNGGAAGSIGVAGLAGGVALGYAVANTDLGTNPGGLPYVGFNALIGRPEVARDFGYRATHEMTVLTKEIVGLYYGHAAKRSYFVGGSTGGQQALSEAQRYPNDYDGIIAEDPAEDRTHLHVRFARLRQLGSQPGAAISPAQWHLWHSTILKSCVGKDGGAPGDEFLTNPLQCTVSPRVLLCKPDQDAATCLQEPQVKALESTYDGTRNPRTGQLIYFADVRGAEDQISPLYGETALSQNFDVTHWVLPPDRSSASFDFDQDMAHLDAKYAAVVNAMNPDLTAFAAHGGKLILLHGWEDGFISPLDALDYYRRIEANGHDKSVFVRLFLAPGVSHAIGGSGPDSFGQAAGIRPGTRGSATAENDLLMAMDRWSETGVAPDALIAGQYKGGVLGSFLSGDGTNDEAPIATRPLCAYPKFPRYNGEGDVTQASSFTCALSSPEEYTEPAKQYLK